MDDGMLIIIINKKQQQINRLNWWAGGRIVDKEQDIV
jgi:hypothetical protein